MTRDQAAALEAAANDAERGVQRRVMLGVHTMDVEKLARFRLTEPAAYGDVAGVVLAFATHANALKTIADEAVARLQLAETMGAAHG